MGAWLSNDQAQTTGSRFWPFPTSSTIRRRTPAHGIHHCAFEYGELRRAELELPASPGGRDQAGAVPRPRNDVLLLLRRPRRKQRGAAGRLLRRLARSKEWMRSSEEFAANPIGQFVDPERVAADRADGMASRTSTPRRRRGVTRLGSRRSRSLRSPDAPVPLRRRRGTAPRHRRGRARASTGSAGPSVMGWTRFGCWRRSSRASSWPSASTTPTTSPRAAWRRRSSRCSSTSRSPAWSGLTMTCTCRGSSNLLDYEGELAIVIGTRCRHVSEERRTR